MRSFLVCCLATLATGALPQEVRLLGTGGYGADAPYAALFNARTIISFTGKVSGRYVSPPQRGMAEAVLLIVRTANGGSSLVELGPAWYVERQDAKIAVGDKVEVTGSKIFLDGRGSILATHVVKGRRVLALRERTGRPYWDAFRVSAARAATSTSSTLIGEIRRFDVYSDRAYGEQFFYFEIATTRGDVRRIALGPRWFIERQDLQLSEGDEVVVETWTPNGTRVQFPFAQTVVRGRQTLNLRTADGRHAWDAWRRG